MAHVWHWFWPRLDVARHSIDRGVGGFLDQRAWRVANATDKPFHDGDQQETADE